MEDAIKIEDQDYAYAPAEIAGIVDMAKAMIKLAIADAVDGNFSVKTEKGLAAIEAVDWLFYSQDDQPFSLGWCLEVAFTHTGEVISSAAARLNLLRQPAFLKRKEEFDAMVCGGRKLLAA